MKARHAVIRDPLYKIRLHLYHGPESRLVVEAKRDKVDIEAHGGAGRTLNYRSPGYGQLVVHIWVDGQQSLRTPFGVSVVAHECVHAANAVFDHIGAAPTLSWHADEPYAYYVEWLVRSFMQEMAQ